MNWAKTDTRRGAGALAAAVAVMALWATLLVLGRGEGGELAVEGPQPLLDAPAFAMPQSPGWPPDAAADALADDDFGTAQMPAPEGSTSPGASGHIIELPAFVIYGQVSLSQDLDRLDAATAAAPEAVGFAMNPLD